MYWIPTSNLYCTEFPPLIHLVEICLAISWHNSPEMDGGKNLHRFLDFLNEKTKIIKKCVSFLLTEMYYVDIEIIGWYLSFVNLQINFLWIRYPVIVKSFDCELARQFCINSLKKKRKELSLCHKLWFSNFYIFGTKCCRP